MYAPGINRFLLPLISQRNFTLCSHQQVQCQKAESKPIRQADKRACKLLPKCMPAKPSITRQNQSAKREGGMGGCNSDMTVFVYECVCET